MSWSYSICLLDLKNGNQLVSNLKFFIEANVLNWSYATCVNALNFTGRNHIKVSGGFEVKLIKFAILCAISFASLTVVPFLIQRWLLPCNLATPFYFIIPACRQSSPEWTTSSKITLFIICMVTHYFRYDGGGAWIIFQVDFSLVQVCSLRRYLDWTAAKIRASSEKALVYFRHYSQIQILSCYYNLIQQDILINTNLGMSMSKLNLSIYALLTIGLHNISFAELVLFVFVMQDSVILLLFYTTVMSKLFETSKGLVGRMKLNVLSRMAVQTKKRKLIEKTMWSFKRIKSYVGYANYVDKRTPFVMFDFCITQIVNLLLVK